MTKKKELLQYCAGQSLSLTRQNKLKLLLLARQYNTSPSKIVNSLLDDVSGPPSWARNLLELEVALSQGVAQDQKGNDVMKAFLQKVSVQQNQ